MTQMAQMNANKNLRTLRNSLRTLRFISHRKARKGNRKRALEALNEEVRMNNQFSATYKKLVV